MLENLFADSSFKNKNILILGAARSGTHALASKIQQYDNTLSYLGECGMHQEKKEPWKDFEQFTNCNPRKLGHVVQRYSKIFAVHQAAQIKHSSLIVEIRRRNKVKQFASWMYFQQLGSIYNFQHNGQDYIPPKSITVSLNNIEDFITDQLLDKSFCPDYTFYYEDLDFNNSRIKKNHYVYPIEQIFSNLDFVEQWLSEWKYND